MYLSGRLCRQTWFIDHGGGGVNMWGIVIKGDSSGNITVFIVVYLVFVVYSGGVSLEV